MGQPPGGGRVRGPWVGDELGARDSTALRSQGLWSDRGSGREEWGSGPAAHNSPAISRPRLQGEGRNEAHPRGFEDSVRMPGTPKGPGTQ